MKNLFSLLFLLCVFSFNAQSQEADTLLSPTYTQKADSALRFLDKSRVPYGMLYERVFPYAQLNDWWENDTISTGTWLQAFSEMQRSRYAPAASDSFLNYRNAREIIKGLNFENKIPLFVLHTKYASIDTNAVQDGRFAIIDSVLHDGTNTASPYVIHDLSLPVLGWTAPLLKDIVYEIMLTTGFDFGTQETEIAHVVIRNLTEDAVIADIQAGETQFVSFATEGDLMLQMEVYLTDGTSKTYRQWAKINGEGPDNYDDPCSTDNIPISATTSFTGYGETLPNASAGYGKGEYRIFYRTDGSCSHLLKKPIIIVDAWDPGDQRKISDFFDINNSKLIYKDQVNVKRNLANVLRAKGFDVVILNFTQYQIGTNILNVPYFGQISVPILRDGAADYMERNGRILANLIGEVNFRKSLGGSQEPNVVVGPSMGGQISRYALSWMEKNGWNHNTRLWVAFDSPNWGANIPLGFQVFLQGLALVSESEGAMASYKEQLLAPAARELLINQTYPQYFQSVNASGGILNYLTQVKKHFNNEEPLRLNWRNTLDYYGYPQNTRRIALVNGSSSGGEYHAPGDKMFVMKGYTKNRNKRMMEGEAYFAHNSQSQLAFVESWDIFKVYGNFMTYQWFSTNVFSDDFRRSGRVETPYSKALDGSPGGMYDIQQEFSNSLDTANLSGTRFNWYRNFKAGELLFHLDAMTNNICFIPTVSAMAYKVPTFDWRQPLSVDAAIATGITWFHNAYVPATNQNHVTLDQSNVNWLLSELEPPKLVGPDALKLCSIGTTYTLDKPLLSGQTVMFYKTGNITIVSQTPTSVTVKPISPGYGATGTIEARVSIGPAYSFSHGYQTVTKTINIEDAAYDINFAIVPGCFYKDFVTPVRSGDTYSWSSDGVNYTLPNTDNNHYYGGVGRMAMVGANSPVWARITTQCALSGSIVTSKVFNLQFPGGTNCAYRLRPEQENDRVDIYPNPTTGDWNMTIYNEDAKLIRATLKDVSGRVMWKAETVYGGGSLAGIPGTNLIPGMYFLTLQIDDDAPKNFKLTKQ